MNDWPDVFIHTNNDTPANIDATKLRRVAAIGAACGYFLAGAGPDEARRLAVEVFARGAARQADALRRAVALGSTDDVTAERFYECQDVVEEAGRQERTALESVRALGGAGDARLDGLLADLLKRVTARTEDGIAVVQREVPMPADRIAVDPAASLIPTRAASAIGPMSVYYYDYVADTLGTPAPGDELIHYETLNLVDGRRSAAAIATILRANYGSTSTTSEVVAYLRTLERAGVVTIGK
jgi:hypothetical protein